MTDNATVPMRRARTWSREFGAVNVPLTPERAVLHIIDTAKVRVPCDAALTTGRLEDALFRKVRRQYNTSQAMGAALVVLATLAGLGFGVLVVALAASARGM